jgi:outer membrane protein assembly factor BamD (BamD/ComL family)
MTVRRVILLLIVGSLGVWVLASYRAQRPVAPPLDPYGRGEWYYLASQYDEAVAAYHDAIRGEMDEAKERDARFKIARSYHQGGRYAQALSAYEDFMRRYPHSDEANRAQGHIEWIRQNRGLAP